METKYKRAVKKYNKAVDYIDDLISEHKKEIKELKSNDNKLSDKYESKISKLNDEIKKLEVDKNNITKDFASFKHQRNSIHKEKINGYKNKISTLIKQNEGNLNSIRTLKKDIDKQKRLTKKYKKKYKKYKSKSKPKTGGKRTKRKNLSSIKKSEFISIYNKL